MNYDKLEAFGIKVLQNVKYDDNDLNMYKQDFSLNK